MATDIKIFHSSQAGSPALTGQAGSLTALLDACLVNGFGLGTVDSVVIAGGVGTVSRSTGHPFDPDSIGLLTGATVTGGSVNGEHRVLTTTTNTWTFDATGIPDQTATGTITQKMAPAGWGKAFSSSNVAAYRSSDVAGSRMYLRVDDTNAAYSLVRGYETMSDVDTGTGPFPTDAQISGGGVAYKSNVASSASRTWVLVADSRAFYLIVNWAPTGTYANNPHSAQLFFGDIVPFKAGDGYVCALNCASSYSAATQPGTDSADMDSVRGPSGLIGPYAARSYNGLGGSCPLRRLPPFAFASTSFSGRSGDNTGFLYPNGPDGGLYVAPITVVETANLSLRGTLPGFYYSPQNIGNGVFASRERVTGITSLPGRKLVAMNSSSGVFFVDITGPWR